MLTNTPDAKEVPLTPEQREARIKLAQELFKSGAISLDEMLDAIKLK